MYSILKCFLSKFQITRSKQAVADTIVEMQNVGNKMQNDKIINEIKKQQNKAEKELRNRQNLNQLENKHCKIGDGILKENEEQANRLTKTNLCESESKANIESMKYSKIGNCDELKTATNNNIINEEILNVIENVKATECDVYDGPSCLTLNETILHAPYLNEALLKSTDSNLNVNQKSTISLPKAVEFKIVTTTYLPSTYED